MPHSCISQFIPDNVYLPDMFICVGNLNTLLVIFRSLSHWGSHPNILIQTASLKCTRRACRSKRRERERRRQMPRKHHVMTMRQLVPTGHTGSCHRLGKRMPALPMRPVFLKRTMDVVNSNSSVCRCIRIYIYIYVYNCLLTNWKSHLSQTQLYPPSFTQRVLSISGVGTTPPWPCASSCRQAVPPTSGAHLPKPKITHLKTPSFRSQNEDLNKEFKTEHRKAMFAKRRSQTEDLKKKIPNKGFQTKDPTTKTSNEISQNESPKLLSPRF